ncbi:MAG: lysophospholipid acyltransferase family protein [Chthoniobacterales bacterium]
MPSDTGYAATTSFLWLLFAPFVRRRIIGRAHVPSRGACILAPNHISHFDPPLLGPSIRRTVDWMAMRDLFEIPVVGKWLNFVGTFPVEMGKLDSGAVRTAITRLREGRMVGVFPEGGLRTGPNSVREGAPLRPGVSALAQMTGAHVLPCVIIGSDALYTPQRWWPLRRTRIWIVFGEPLDPPGDQPDKAAARTDFEQRLGDILRDLYQRTVREEKIPADCLPQTPQRRKGKA